MDFVKTTDTFLSTNGVNNVKYFVYAPTEGAPKAMIQLIHGMAEHVERYEDYIANFTAQGYLVYGDNHIGHKDSVSTDEDLGYFAPKDGWRYMVQDEILLTEKMKEAYPGIPVFLYGHSMGSFLTRAYLALRGELVNGAVISGSAGPNPALGAGKVVTKLVKIKGEKYRSPFITKVMFGSYNSHIPNAETDYDWLTRDKEIVKKYNEDPYCGFMFTISGYLDLENLLGFVTDKGWYDKLPLALPMFFISGEEDPVCNWGDGMRKVDAEMQKRDFADYSMKLYPGMRHELHNEIGREEVVADVLGWLEEHMQA